MPAPLRPASAPTSRRRRIGLVPRFVVAMSLALGLLGAGALPAQADSGTPHYDGTYTVHEDGSISMTEVQTITENAGCPSQEDLDHQVERMSEPPKTIKAFSGQGRCGYSATWKTVPMSELKTSEGMLAGLFTSVKRDGSELDLTIRNKLIDDPSDSTVSWTFVFPDKIDRAQGGTIDGHRATWSDMRHAPREIHVQGHLEKDFPWLVVILNAVGALVVIAAVIVVLLLLRRRRHRSVPPQPGPWGPPFQSSQAGPPLPPSMPPNQQSPWQGPPPQA